MDCLTLITSKRVDSHSHSGPRRTKSLIIGSDLIRMKRLVTTLTGRRARMRLAWATKICDLPRVEKLQRQRMNIVVETSLLSNIIVLSQASLGQGGCSAILSETSPPSKPDYRLLFQSRMLAAVCPDLSQLAPLLSVI